MRIAKFSTIVAYTEQYKHHLLVTQPFWEHEIWQL